MYARAIGRELAPIIKYHYYYILHGFISFFFYQQTFIFKTFKQISHTTSCKPTKIKELSQIYTCVVTCDQIIKRVPGRGKRIKSVYRVAELAHILCTASWSQVAKCVPIFCVPIHSKNTTTTVRSLSY